MEFGPPQLPPASLLSGLELIHKPWPLNILSLSNCKQQEPFPKCKIFALWLLSVCFRYSFHRFIEVDPLNVKFLTWDPHAILSTHGKYCFFVQIDILNKDAEQNRAGQSGLWLVHIPWGSSVQNKGEWMVGRYTKMQVRGQSPHPLFY